MAKRNNINYSQSTSLKGRKKPKNPIYIRQEKIFQILNSNQGNRTSRKTNHYMQQRTTTLENNNDSKTENFNNSVEAQTEGKRSRKII